MILGVSYTVWDGEELLEYSIKSIRRNVDYIAVVWQKISYFGELCNDGLEALLYDLKRQGLIDELYLYEPDMLNGGIKKAGIDETRKRNIGLWLCRENGCDYHMTMDCDEFYEYEQFEFMKKEMVQGAYGTGYAQHIQYYRDSIYQLKNPEKEFISTIEKITPKTKYIHSISCIVPVDPTRKTNNVQEGMSYRIFTREECQMHHLSFVRKDIGKKLKNRASGSWTEDEIQRIVDYYEKWQYPNPCMWAKQNLLEVIQVPRRFEIYKH